MSSHSSQMNTDAMSPTVGDVAPELVKKAALQNLADIKVPPTSREPVESEALEHREFKDGEFWRQIPAFKDTTTDEFMSTSFQLRNTLTRADNVRELLGDIVSDEFLTDVERGLAEAPMNLRISPYLFSLVDWQNP